MYAKNRSLRRPPIRRPTSTKFCVSGRIPDIFLGFEFQKDRLESVGSVRDRNSGLAIDKTSLIGLQQLVTTAQAVTIIR